MTFFLNVLNPYVPLGYPEGGTCGWPQPMLARVFLHFLFSDVVYTDMKDLSNASNHIHSIKVKDLLWVPTY